ncbi:tyrosyl-tRNA synthetase [Serratia symbiotica str. 'Cinara cedri']|nr:tyrosyl-tRNA synthetase [Serratia symbiotica str. 'Cinara cedri']
MNFNSSAVFDVICYFYSQFILKERFCASKSCIRLYMELLMGCICLIRQLQERGLVAQVTDELALVNRLAEGPITLYCGFDPTATSLHLGHLIPLLCLKRFQLAGHKPVLLIGGATGLIGDPSFKATERKLNTNETVSQWVDKIHHQITPFLNFNSGGNSAITANNYDWFSGVNVLTFLRDIGKHFSVNQMINKESVRQRLNRNNSGISFTEFSYSLLQGFDFRELYHRYKVELQIGGSDQWGNITSGIDLIRRMDKKSVFGLTMPLITKADGTKFGKTEDGAVWLSAEKTSPYKFYQFWINTADADVYRFLKAFTFLSLEDISALEKEDQNNSSKAPYAQYVLAEEVTRIVHGTEGLSAAKRITKSLFCDVLYDMIEADFAQLAQDGMPTIILSKGADLQDTLVHAKLVPSRVQARTMISSNAVSINGKKQSDVEYRFCDADRLFGRYTLLRRGKKHFCLVDWK